MVNYGLFFGPLSWSEVESLYGSSTRVLPSPCPRVVSVGWVGGRGPPGYVLVEISLYEGNERITLWVESLSPPQIICVFDESRSGEGKGKRTSDRRLHISVFGRDGFGKLPG